VSRQAAERLAGVAVGMAAGAGNVVDLSYLFQLFLPVGLPCIGRLFIDTGAGRTCVLGLVVLDLADGVQQFLEDDHGLGGMGGGQQRRFAGEAHESVLHLRMHETLGGFTCLRGDSQGGEGAGKHTTSPDGTELLPAPVRGMARPLCDRLAGFLSAGGVCHGPAAPGQGDARTGGDTAGGDEVRQEHRDRPHGIFEAHGAQAERRQGAALGWREVALEGIRGREPEARFGLPAVPTGRDGRKGGGRWTAHQIKVRVLMAGREAAIAGEAAVQKAPPVGGPQGEPGLRVLPCIAFLERADRATDRQAAAHIVDGRDQALWGMASAWMLQAALRIAGLPQGLGSGQSLWGPLAGKDRQAGPKIRLARRQDLIGQRDGLAEERAKGLPGPCRPRFRQSAPVGAGLFWPEPPPPGHSAARAPWALDAFLPPTGDQRKEHNQQACERELTTAGEVWGTVLGDHGNKAVAKREQTIIKLDRSRRFLGASSFSSLSCHCMSPLKPMLP
jgi:hypothetical protein